MASASSIQVEIDGRIVQYVRELESLIESYRLTNEALRNRIDELLSVIAKANKRVEEAEAIEFNLAKRLSDSAVRATALEAEVNRLTVALYDDAAQKLGDAMLEASRLRAQVADLTAERDAWQYKHNDLVARLDRAQMNANGERNQLEQMLRVLAKEIAQPVST